MPSALIDWKIGRLSDWKCTRKARGGVTVTDQSRDCLTGFPAYWSSGWDGCPVKDLAEDAFQVSEDGVRQGITVFSRGDMPIAISLLIDVRSPAKARTSEVHEAALGLVQKLRAQDMAAVMGFENGVETYHPLTSSRTDLERAIRGTSSRALSSAPNLLSSLFRRREPPPSTVNAIRRHAIVFLSDGEVLFEAGILLLARRFDAAVYVIGLMGDQPLEESREPALSMRRLASLTGGRAFFPTDGRRLTSTSPQTRRTMVVGATLWSTWTAPTPARGRSRDTSRANRNPPIFQSTNLPIQRFRL